MSCIRAGIIKILNWFRLIKKMTLVKVQKNGVSRPRQGLYFQNPCYMIDEESSDETDEIQYTPRSDFHNFVRRTTGQK